MKTNKCWRDTRPVTTPKIKRQTPLFTNLYRTKIDFYYFFLRYDVKNDYGLGGVKIWYRRKILENHRPSYGVAERRD